jgi:hypothetical protein
MMLHLIGPARVIHLGHEHDVANSMYVPQRLMESGATAGGTSRDAGKTDSHLF